MNNTTPSTVQSRFSELYVNLREKEGRICSDEEAAGLPFLPPGHPHYEEWKLRKQSTRRLVHYLEKKKIPLRILEVGCGNGWLSHRLTGIPHSKVTGMDINLAEISQAKRVFGSVAGLRFLYADIHSEILRDIPFDCIVLAACVQYFPSVPVLLADLFPLLGPCGEIHILDTPFYKPATVGPARERSVTYYRSMGFPEMADQYFHHEENVLRRFACQVLYRPPAFHFSLLPANNPFPWYCIKKP